MLLAGFLVLQAGCGGAPTRPAGTFAPINPSAAVFWDRQTTESARLLQQFGAAFNQTWKGLPIQIERAGTYPDIYRKTTASIRAGELPAMAVSYESMTAEYIAAGAVAPLDEFLKDPELGISPEELDDFFPSVLASNRFEEHGGGLYSFPYTKSVLMLFYNRRVLDAAGVAAVPATWDEFLAACRAVKAKTGEPAIGLAADCSTFNGLLFSMGGAVNRGRETLYDSPESVRVLELYETLINEGLAYPINPGTFDDEVALVNDKAAFTLRTSSGRGTVGAAMGDARRWGMAMIPQADPSRPATVLFGANVSIFKTDPAQQRAAWAFLRDFTATDNLVQWAIATGYLPIRKSAAQHPDMLAFWAEADFNRAAFDCLPFARAEPNIAGWQEVRKAVEDAQMAVFTKVKTGRAAALELKKTADAILARDAGGTR